MQNPAVSNAPIAFAGISPLPCPPSADATFHEVLEAGSDSFPTFPDITTQASADFSRFVVTAYPCGLALETSPVMDVFFPSYTCLIYSESSEQLWDFVLFSRLIHSQSLGIKFLYVGSDVCLRLPSDSTSRWTPLLSAVAFPLLGRDLHPLGYVRAGRTNKKQAASNLL